MDLEKVQFLAEKMEFDLISKKGKIIKGETNFNQSFYNGETLTKDQNELFYINNSIFTTCNWITHIIIFIVIK